MQTRNIVSNNLVEFVLQLEQAVAEGFKVVKESVDFQAGYFKSMTQKQEDSIVMTIDPEKSKKISDRGRELVINSLQEPIVLDAKEALEMIDNPGEPNEKLKEILELDAPVAVKKPVRRGKK